MARYSNPEVLVETNWVKDNLGKPGIKLIEIDVDTKAYDAGHIPGAVGFNWQTQLQDQVRRDIISKDAFEKLVGGAGVSPSDSVILYGDNNNWFAAYGFWLFKIYGHKDVRLMNGGRVKWLNENDKPMTTDVPSVTPSSYKASAPNLDLRAMLPQVFEAQKGNWNLGAETRSDRPLGGQAVRALRGPPDRRSGGAVPRRPDPCPAQL